MIPTGIFEKALARYSTPSSLILLYEMSIKVSACGKQQTCQQVK